jgi:hypothetical protein
LPDERHPCAQGLARAVHFLTSPRSCCSTFARPQLENLPQDLIFAAFVRSLTEAQQAALRRLLEVVENNDKPLSL